MVTANVPAAPDSPAGRAISHRGGRGTVAPQPETLVREYRNNGDYLRDASRLQRVGWEVVSVLERPVPPDWLRRASGGRLAWPAAPEAERLVTYVWQGRVRRSGQALHAPAHPADKRPEEALRWWLTLVIVLVLLLTLGLLSFFGDNLLPGLLALAVLGW